MGKRKKLTDSETWALWVIQNEKQLKELHYKYMCDCQVYIDFKDFANFIYHESPDLINNEN